MSNSIRIGITRSLAAVAATIALSAVAAAPEEGQARNDAQAPESVQEPQTALPGAQQDAPAIQGDVSDEKLRQFAEAAAEVQKIQQEYAAKAQSLQKTTEEEIVSSVQDAGMTVAEFTAIVELIQSDPELARRLDGVSSP